MRRYHEIFTVFCSATGMEISCAKSCFLSSMDVMDQMISDLFLFDHRNIDEGIKYLGFTLKPNGYTKTDWTWPIDRVIHKITLWCYRWLTLGG